MLKRETWQDLQLLLCLATAEDWQRLQDTIDDARAHTILLEAAQPPRLLYADERPGYTDVHAIDLPGLLIPEPTARDRRQFYEMIIPGVYLPVLDHERTWLEQTEDGVVIPHGSAYLLDWARATGAGILARAPDD